MDGWWWFVGYHIRRTNGIWNAGQKSHHIEKWFCTQEAPEGFGSLISCVEALWHFMRVSKLLDRMLLFPKVFSIFGSRPFDKRPQGERVVRRFEMCPRVV